MREGPWVSGSAALPETPPAGQRPPSRGHGRCSLETGFGLMSLCFMLSSWTNQIPSSTVSALSVQLWLTGPVWAGVRGAGTLIGLGERLTARGPGEEVGWEMALLRGDLVLTGRRHCGRASRRPTVRALCTCAPAHIPPDQRERGLLKEPGLLPLPRFRGSSAWSLFVSPAVQPASPVGGGGRLRCNSQNAPCPFSVVTIH